MQLNFHKWSRFYCELILAQCERKWPIGILDAEQSVFWITLIVGPWTAWVAATWVIKVVHVMEVPRAACLCHTRVTLKLKISSADVWSHCVAFGLSNCTIACWACVYLPLRLVNTWDQLAHVRAGGIAADVPICTGVRSARARVASALCHSIHGTALLGALDANLRDIDGIVVSSRVVYTEIIDVVVDNAVPP